MNSNRNTNKGNGIELPGPFHFELESIIGEMRISKVLNALNNGVVRYGIRSGEFIDVDSGTRAVITSSDSRYDKLDVHYVPGKLSEAWEFIRKMETALREPLIYAGKHYPIMIYRNGKNHSPSS